MAVLLASTVAAPMAAGVDRYRSEPGVPVIGVDQIAPATALDQVVTGIKAGLARRGYVLGKTYKLDYKDADGSIPLTESIARGFVARHVSVLVPISTPSAEAAEQAAKGSSVPIVFAGVSDPLASHLLKTVTSPSHQDVTGVYNTTKGPVVEQAKIIHDVMPKLSALGAIYDPGTAQSALTVNQLTAAARRYGISIVRETVTTSSAVPAAASALVGKAQAMYMPEDTTVNAALGALIATEHAQHLPLFTDDVNSVAEGAVLTFSHSEYAIGFQAASLIARVLKGYKVGSLRPVESGPNRLYYNSKTMAYLGLKLPSSLKVEALDIANGVRAPADNTH